MSTNITLLRTDCTNKQPGTNVFLPNSKSKLGGAQTNNLLPHGPNEYKISWSVKVSIQIHILPQISLMTSEDMDRNRDRNLKMMYSDRINAIQKPAIY